MNKLDSGHEVVAMNDEWLARMGQEQTVNDFKFSESDTVVMGVPRSGMTWVLEIVRTMRHNPDLNNQTVHLPIFIRAPHTEINMMLDGTVETKQFTEVFRKLCPGEKVEDEVFLQTSEALSVPRLIKTQIPLSLLPPDLLDKTKVVYIARNPKDVVVSLFHHFCNPECHDYTGTFENFVNHFINGDLLPNPYWPNLMMAWKRKDHHNMHFLFYEDLIADLKKELGILNEFLGTKLSQQQLDNVVQHASFASMKARSIKDEENYHDGAHESEDPILRKGETGDWKNHFSAELAQEMDRWIVNNSEDITFK